MSLAGTIGHVKSVLDSMLRRGELEKVIWMKGTPTIMIGDIDDPNFEEHLKETALPEKPSSVSAPRSENVHSPRS